MNNAPERIWVATYAAGFDGDCDVSPEKYPHGEQTEYVRADLVPQWQPIETAPRNGTELFLFDEMVFIGSWGNDYNFPKEPKGWFDNSWDDFSCGYGSTPLNPTHWMTKPTPPKGLQEES